jgi:hypothetical protein
MTYRATSRDAWKAFLPASPILDDMILAALKAAGTLGATCEEIEETIERKHQAVSGNLSHLVKAGAVECTGTFGKTRSGRRAIKWRVAA